MNQRKKTSQRQPSVKVAILTNEFQCGIVMTSTALLVLTSYLLLFTPFYARSQETLAVTILERDTRECAPPFCGGFFIRELNRRYTRCHSTPSRYKRQHCYISHFDFSSLTLSTKETERLESLLSEGAGIVTGHYVTPPAPSRSRMPLSFKVKSVYSPQKNSVSSNGMRRTSFYKLEDSGIRCVTTPCPTIEVTKVNRRRTRVVVPDRIERTLDGTEISLCQGCNSMIVRGRLQRKKENRRFLKVLKVTAVFEEFGGKDVLLPEGSLCESEALDSRSQCMSPLECKFNSSPSLSDIQSSCRDPHYCFNQYSAQENCSALPHPAIPGRWGCVENQCSWIADIVAPPLGEEGDTCGGFSASPPPVCQEGLACKPLSDIARDVPGTCRPELFCLDESSASDYCSNLLHIAVPGAWGCEENTCVWRTQEIIVGENEPCGGYGLPPRPVCAKNLVCVFPYADQIPDAQGVCSPPHEGEHSL